MSDLLYLDTARLGRMSPGAAAALRGFVALAGDEGGGLYFDRFLVGGLPSCPASFASRYPGLAEWRGVRELKTALRSLCTDQHDESDHSDRPVLLASRASALLKLAARLLFHPCRNVLTTDLDWPPYSAALTAEAYRGGRTVTQVAVRDAVLGGRLTADELVDVVCDHFAREQCDGLYLTAVSNLGVRTPVDRIVRRLEAEHVVRAVVIDGAQEYAHVSPSPSLPHADLFLAGAHKWLGAHHPLGVAFYGRRRSRGRVETILAEMQRMGDLDDPLLRFTTFLESGTRGPLSETVSLAPLFTARGAVSDAVHAGNSFDARLENLKRAFELVAGTGWEPLLPSPDLRSGILLIRPPRHARHTREPDALRLRLREAGVAASAYGGGLVRLSMPSAAWQRGELAVLEAALASIA